jgi:hypothetical protein
LCQSIQKMMKYIHFFFLRKSRQIVAPIDFRYATKEPDNKRTDALKGKDM